MKLLITFAILLCLTSVSPSIAASPFEMSIEVANRCLSGKEGSFAHLGTKVISFDSLIGGQGQTAPFCLVDTRCFITNKNPEGSRGSWACEFTDGRCQTFPECVSTMKNSKNFGFGKSKPAAAKNYVARTARRCSVTRDNGVVYADFTNAGKISEYKAVCSQNLSCKLSSGAIELYQDVLCPTKGRGSFPEGGSFVEYDTCPGADECFDTKLSLPSEQEYLRNIRLVRAQAINETFPHSSNSESGTALRESPVSATHNRNIDPL